MSFKAQCPYCQHVVQASQEAVGASVRCPKCSDFFTLAPVEDAPLPAQLRGRSKRLIPSRAETTESETATEPPAKSAAPDASDFSPVEEMRRAWLQPAGVVAFFLGGVGLMLASFPQWKWLTIPLSGIGLAVGVGGLLYVRAQNVPGQAMTVVGSGVSLMVLGVALILPDLLGPSFYTPTPVVSASKLEVIPLDLAKPVALDQTGHIDASLAALQLGVVRVQIISASIAAPAPKKQGEPALAVRLRVLRLEDEKESVKQRLVFTGSAGEPPRLILKDGTGKTYQQKEIKTFVAEEKEPRPPPFPMAVADEVAVFDVPLRGQDLRLEVPGSAWGGKGVFRFVIPSNMIQSEPPRATARGS